MSKAAERLRELAEIAESPMMEGFPATPDELQDAALLRAVADWLDGHGSPKRYHSDRCDHYIWECNCGVDEQQKAWQEIEQIAAGGAERGLPKAGGE